MNWDEWRGSLAGVPTFWSKTLLRFRGCKICLHKFVGTDEGGCYHTHPAFAIRIILWGGYIEELESGAIKAWRPGMAGAVRPCLSHRVVSILNGRVSYSLWLRGPVTATVELRGSGWTTQSSVLSPQSSEAAELPL